MIELHPEILSNNGAPQFAVLRYDEFLRVEEMLRRLTGTMPEPDPRYGGFWDNLTAEELARRQGVKPITDFSELTWPYGPDDWEGFEQAVDTWRDENPIQ